VNHVRVLGITLTRGACLLLALAVLTGRAGAHEIGKTQVTATFYPTSVYQIDVAVDPDALLTKLAVFSGQPLPSGLDRAQRDQRIEALASVFLDAVRVDFDGVADRPHFQYRPASALNDYAAMPSIVRLTGRTPAGARVVTFADSLAMGSYALNLRIGDSPQQTLWLEGPHPSDPMSLIAPPPPATQAETAWQHLRLGYTHILPNGLDHILFVVGIFLLSARWRPLLLQISTFTIAHSITLGLTMYGIVSLPARVVEPMIAVSIAYVAIENLLTNELKPWRVALVFSFGLLHGMGFAGVLKDVGLPRSQFLTALVAFNVGVEAGQLTVIAIAFAAVAHWRRKRPAYRRLIVQPASLGIAVCGLFWTFQRAFG
jgi:hydrogenase/urease accessory protein HupE